MNTATAYPLQWPNGWEVTQYRETARFKTTLPAALAFLKKEINLLGGTSLVLSSNYTLGDERPKNPGVCAYFVLRKQHIAIPCDRWTTIECNVKAIALTVEAMRGMERWGAKHMITAMFQGFTALPGRSGASCWDVLGIPSGSNEKQIMDAYYVKAQTEHPDKGGTAERFDALAKAKDLALSTVRNNSK